jgi:hypothetical protein
MVTPPGRLGNDVAFNINLWNCGTASFSVSDNVRTEFVTEDATVRAPVGPTPFDSGEIAPGHRKSGFVRYQAPADAGPDRVTVRLLLGQVRRSATWIVTP